MRYKVPGLITILFCDIDEVVVYYITNLRTYTELHREFTEFHRVKK